MKENSSLLVYSSDKHYEDSKELYKINKNYCQNYIMCIMLPEVDWLKTCIVDRKLSIETAAWFTEIKPYPFTPEKPD